MQEGFTKIGFARAFIVPALLLFAIPALGAWFSDHALDHWNALFLDGVSEAVQSDAELTAERRAEIISFYGAHSASSLCAAGDKEALPPGYYDEVCGDFAQVRWIGIASRGSLGLGVLSLLVVLGCVGYSFVSREAQYRSFVVGWSFLRIASLLQVLAQGAITIALSFWVTAFFFQRYSIKLIFVLGLLAVVAAFIVIAAIFAKTDDKLEVEGELLTREKSPGLWARIEAICQKLGTAPPDQIAGGIDDNFFVTEHPVQLQGSELRGRTLFVSLSLLKRLSRSEADAVLAHEMAHFSGGDTTHSRKLAPLLSKYGHYLQALYEGVLSRPIFYFMLFYRSMFQLSLGKSSRERELRADDIAKNTTSAENMAHALLKVAAYSAYRARVEEGLFERERRHSSLDIADSVATGFSEYAGGPKLAFDLNQKRFPHPFDSHPDLATRIKAVGLDIAPEQYPDLVVVTASETWFAEIGDAERIEGELWKAYEARFQAAHEQSLAYRYLPATPEERAHVERFFPPRELLDKDGRPVLHIDFEKMSFAEWEAPALFERIESLKVEDGVLSKVLEIMVLKDDGKKQKLKLPFKQLAAKQEEVLEVVGNYYGRHRVARSHKDGKLEA